MQIEQIDRDAAADLIEAQYAREGVAPGRLQTPAETRRGERDHCIEVQHMARQRLAALSARPAGDYVMVRKAALDWLFGEGPDDDGLHFGDEEAPRGKGAFWWRSKFRAMIAARPAVGEDVVEKGNAMAKAIADLLGSMSRQLVGGGDGQTFTMTLPSAGAWNAANNAKREWCAAIAAMGSDMGKSGEG